MAKNTAKPAKKLAKKKIDFRGEIVYLCSCCAAIILLTLAGLNFNRFLFNNQVLGVATTSQGNYETLIEEKAYWQDFLKVNPRYLDGWVELIQVNLDLNDKTAAKETYNKAREIDPNSIKLTPFKGVFGD